MIINWNPIELYIRAHQLDPKKTMNQLQASGIISDNAVIARDVAAADCARAVERLERRHLLFLICHSL